MSLSETNAAGSSGCSESGYLGRIVNGYGTTNNNGNLQWQKNYMQLGAVFWTGFEYDALNRLKSARETYGPGDAGANSAQAWKQTNIFDRWGNRTIDANNTTANVNRTVYEVNTSNNQLAPSGQGEMLYDAAGNLHLDTYTPATMGKGYRQFDAENRITQNMGESAGGQGLISFFNYDGNGRRIEMWSESYASTFVYGADGSLVFDQGANKEHVYLNGELLFTASTNPAADDGIVELRWLIKDHLGTPRIVLDQTGNVKRHDYLPFGEELDASIGWRVGNSYGDPDGVRQQFTGYERDLDTGLDYAKARYFGSQLGRFTSPDSVLNDSESTDPQSWNLYVYVSNNPLRFIDPTGRKIWISFTDRITEIDADGNEIQRDVNRRVEYTFGGLRNEDGSDYTGDNSYALAAQASLDFMLQDHDVLGPAIAELVGSRENFTIMRHLGDPNINRVEPQAKGRGTTIYWSGNDSSFWGNMTETNRSGRATATNTLAHELIGHAWIRFKGFERPGAMEIRNSQSGYGVILNAEIDAVNMENRANMIEDTSGRSNRYTYGGWDISEGLMRHTGKPTIKLSPRARSRGNQ